jgi:glucokinase
MGRSALPRPERPGDDDRDEAHVAPMQMLSRRSHPHLVVVADLGATHVRVAAVVGGRLGKVTTHRTADLDPSADGERPPDIVAGVIGALRAAAPPGERIDLVGLAVSALVDARGRISGPLPSGLPEGLCLRGAIETALDAPTLVDRTASLAALGEARQGAGRGHRDVVLILVDETITIGIVSGGRVVRGAHGAAGAAGLLLLPAHRGVTGRDAEARVPRIGAAITDAPTGYVRLEDLVGATGLARTFTDGTRPLDLRPDVADRRGKAAARQAVEGWALLIADVCAILDPDVVVLGGQVVVSAPGLAEPLRRRVADLAMLGPDIPLPEIRIGRLGPRAALIGASIAARIALNTGALRTPPIRDPAPRDVAPLAG